MMKSRKCASTDGDLEMKTDYLALITQIGMNGFIKPECHVDQGAEPYRMDIGSPAFEDRS